MFAVVPHQRIAFVGIVIVHDIGPSSSSDDGRYEILAVLSW